MSCSCSERSFGAASGNTSCGRRASEQVSCCQRRHGTTVGGDVDVGLWEGGGEGGGGGAEEEVVVVVEEESCTTELGEKYNASVSKSLQCPRFLELGG